MAADEKGPAAGRAPGFGEAPLPPDTAAPALGSGSCTPQSLALDQPVPAGHPDLRLLPGEAAFQDLTEEPLLKRPRTACEAVWEGSLLFHPFPRKLWTIVHSSRFASIGWNEDGTCIGVNRPLFQKEVLDRDGLDKVFKTERVESFIRQLNRYGFSSVPGHAHVPLHDQPVHEGAARPRPERGRKVMVSERVSGMSKLGHSVLLGPGPAFSKEALGRLGEGAQGPSQAAAACEQLFCDSGFPFLSQPRPQLHFYHSPLFQRDCPHLLVRMKPRVHTKPASGQVDGEPAALGHLPAPSAAEPQDGLPPYPEHIQGTPSYPQLDHASALAGTDSVAPAPPWTAAEPPAPDPNAQVLVPLVPVLAEVAQPAEVPWLCCAWPPAQMSPPWPVPGLAAAPPQLLSLPPAQLPGAALLPLAHPGCPRWPPGLPPP
ncbi:heat shock transcription factor, X-linked-like [Globicephala melas]|uniref:heat shock transcription factor, X-linked-like n=1 Tax=Globicephala melas TaxID=9731 RepID=UPI0038730C57